jgi:hypothetical protein
MFELPLLVSDVVKEELLPSVTFPKDTLVGLTERRWRAVRRERDACTHREVSFIAEFRSHDNGGIMTREFLYAFGRRPSTMLP